MFPGGKPGTTTAETEALAALRETWKFAYDVGIVTVAGQARPIVLWVAVRLEGDTPEPLIGFTAEALEAAIRDDWGEEP